VDRGIQLQLVSQIFNKWRSTYTSIAKGGSKEGFLKKLQICMKHYDYKDETKDVRGKVILMKIMTMTQILIID
jgi:hypothetical protein